MAAEERSNSGLILTWVIVIAAILALVGWIAHFPW